METLVERLGTISLDPVTSPLGIAVVLLAVFAALKAVRRAVKVTMVLLVLVGLYLTLYTG